MQTGKRTVAKQCSKMKEELRGRTQKYKLNLWLSTKRAKSREHVSSLHENIVQHFKMTLAAKLVYKKYNTVVSLRTQNFSPQKAENNSANISDHSMSP